MSVCPLSPLQTAAREDRSLSQAMAAFSYILLPSLHCPKTRLALYLETAQVTY